MGLIRKSIDLCFVAHRYSDDMSRKGYDQFVEVARLLASDERLRFHVVGDYAADDLPLGEAGARCVFYGPQPNAFFADFYPRMDVILSANRPPRGRDGVFDGFPTGSCMEAGFRGVLNCVADPLDLNVAFEDGRDILLVDRNTQRTAQRLAALFATPDRLYELARANWKRFHEVFDVNRQLWARTRLIVAELLLDEALIIRPPAALSGLSASRTAGVATAGVSSELRSEETIRAVVAEVSRELRSEETIKTMAAEVSREIRSDETIRAMATEVWRERRRRILPYKIWTETSRAWRRFKRKRI